MSVASLSGLHALAERCALYIDELHEFFQLRGLPFGTPQDIHLFASRLDDPAFADEMTSMVRSVLYREEVPLSRSELLEMLALAVGGAHFEEAALDLHTALRRILTFVQEVASSQRRGFDAVKEQPSFATYPIDVPLTASPQPPSLQATSTHSTLTPDPEPVEMLCSTCLAEPVPPVAATQTLSSTLLIQQLPQHAGEQIAIESAAELSSALIANSDSDTSHLPRRTRWSVLRFPFWVVAGSLVLLAAIVIAFLRLERTPARAALPQSVPLQAALQGRPKPTPYGDSVFSGPPPPQPLSNPARTVVRSHRSQLLRNLPAHPSTLLPSVADLPHDSVFIAFPGPMASHLLSAPAPPYPELARLAHVEGKVMLQIVVDYSGNIEAARPVQGPLLLRGASERAVRQWRYKPFVLNGVPTPFATSVTMTFRLRR